jgi:uncharacterized protein YbjT (DUF2867 family)
MTPYLTGRSDALLKLKPLLDAEARVVAHLPGKGRLSGMLGALQVETPAGLRFELGTGLSDAERRNPPPVGALVTYQYRALTPDGVPRFASYLRRREAFEQPSDPRLRWARLHRPALVMALRADGVVPRVLTRDQPEADEVQGDLTDLTDRAALDLACSGIETVFHCAGHAHAFGALGAEEEARHWQVNFEGSRALAEAAGRAGVASFVFLSSVKAVGEPGEACADEDWPVPPDSAYGRAKRAAEAAVLAAGERYGMRVTVLRPAMVFGAGGRGNLERMAALVRRGFFPPLPETGNRRSLVHVSDLVAPCAWWRRTPGRRVEPTSWPIR